jgi:hypothetical protein
MDPELVKVVYAAVRECWEEEERPFDGGEVHRMLEDSGIDLSQVNIDLVWSYLEDLEAIETSAEGSNGAPFIEYVDTAWSAPHTNVTRT